MSRILRMIVRKNLDEAEKQIEGFKPSDEYEAGYLKGLRGIVHALRKPVEGSVIDSGDPRIHLKSMKESVETHYLSREEEGYFNAWMDFLRKLPAGKKSIIEEKPSEQPG